MEQNGYQFTEEHPKSGNHLKFIMGALCGALVVCIAGVCFLLTGVIRFGGSTYLPVAEGTEEEIVSEEVESKLELIRAISEEYFLYDVDEEALKEGIYSGYVSGLGDVYTEYYDEEETKELFESTEGVYSGVGAVLTQNQETGLIQILSVYKDSPAEKAGLEGGDILFSVDGKEITDESLTEVVSWIKGEDGTEVTLGVYRGSDMEELELTAVRGTIEVQTVEYEMKDSQTGYLQIIEFDSVTLDQFNAAVADLEQQGMERLIIDLRSNPGGNLDTVCDILRTMLPEGVIVYTEDKNGERTEYVNEEDHTFDKPLVVLVNGMSASASEIFAGAVQDYGIATVVGTTTYGKGVVQQLIDLGDGTCLKLTISEYFTPNGRSIHGKGVEPDVVVEAEADGEEEETDYQLDKALEIVNSME